MSDRCLYGSEHIGVPCVYCERNEWKARWNTLMSLAREMMVGDAPVGQATGRPRLSKSAAQQLVGIMLDLEDALEAVRRKRRVGDAPDEGAMTDHRNEYGRRLDRTKGRAVSGAPAVPMPTASAVVAVRGNRVRGLRGGETARL